MVSPEQSPITCAFGRTWDAAVVGAGPAGAFAAIHLAAEGHRVLLVDRKGFPREKVCGDGLVNDSIRCLKRAGIYGKVASAGHPVKTASVFSPSLLEVSVPAQYLVVRRKVLDSIVAERAVQAGACFCLGRVQNVEQDGSGALLSLLGERERIRARYCLIATGADISLARRLGMTGDPAPSAAAVRCYVRSAFGLEHMVGFYGKAMAPGYGWIFPAGGGWYNMGVTLFKVGGKYPTNNIRKAFDRFTREFPLASRIVRQSRQSTRLEGGILRCGLRGCLFAVRGRVILAGEVMGTTLPFTGEGIGKAMESGERAGRALCEALREDSPCKLAAFSEAAVRESRPKYDAYGVAQRWLGKSLINDFMARRVIRSPHLQEAVARIVAEEADPRTVFSLRGIWNSMWG